MVCGVICISEGDVISAYSAKTVERTLSRNRRRWNMYKISISMRQRFGDAFSVAIRSQDVESIVHSTKSVTIWDLNDLLMIFVSTV